MGFVNGRGVRLRGFPARSLGGLWREERGRNETLSGKKSVGGVAPRPASKWPVPAGLALWRALWPFSWAPSAGTRAHSGEQNLTGCCGVQGGVCGVEGGTMRGTGAGRDWGLRDARVGAGCVWPPRSAGRCQLLPSRLSRGATRPLCLPTTCPPVTEPCVQRWAAAIALEIRCPGNLPGPSFRTVSSGPVLQGDKGQRWEKTRVFEGDELEERQGIVQRAERRVQEGGPASAGRAPRSTGGLSALPLQGARLSLHASELGKAGQAPAGSSAPMGTSLRSGCRQALS